MLDPKTSKDVIKVMGKERYYDYLHAKGTAFCRNSMFTRKGFNHEQFARFTKYVSENKAVESDYVKFVIDNKDAIANRDIEKLLPKVKKMVKKAPLADSRMYIQMLSVKSAKGFFEHQEEIAGLYDILKGRDDLTSGEKVTLDFAKNRVLNIKK